MKKLSALVTLFTISLVFLAGCKNYRNGQEICIFNDTIVKCDQDSKYVAVMGFKGIYVLYGEYRIIGKVAKAGTLLGYTSSCQFDISELLKKYPAYASDRVNKAAALQHIWIEKHAPHKAPKATEHSLRP